MATPIITSLSLCTGVGMLDAGVGIALKRLGFSHRVLGYCERDAYAASCLLARMEEKALEPAPIWCGCLENMDSSPFRGIDLVAAGFPCQPHSSAGKRESTDDERWIWPAIAEIIRKVEPEWVFLENVRGLLSTNGGAAFRAVVGDLSRLGFKVSWLVCRASDTGARHRRERVFILADRKLCGPKDERQMAAQGREPDACCGGFQMGKPVQFGPQAGNDGLQRTADEPRGENPLSRCCQMGHAGYRKARSGVVGFCESETKTSGEWWNQEAGCGGLPIFAPGPGLGLESTINDLLRLLEKDPERAWQRYQAELGETEKWVEILGHSPWIAPAIKSGVRVLSDGLAVVVDESRADQLRCSGNGVVAWQAAMAFESLWKPKAPQ